MSLPTVEAARAAMLEALPAPPSGPDLVPLIEADGRWLARPIRAGRDQPPFNASAMDGWAVQAADLGPGVRLSIIGESAAGAVDDLVVGPGEAARIFTGAPIPRGADRVVIQEQAIRDGDVVVLTKGEADPAHVRLRAGDFTSGAVLLETGTRITPWRIALVAASGVATAACAPRPRIAILSNGDELLEPGDTASDHQIYNAGGPALTAFIRRHGGAPRPLRIARDTEADILAAISEVEFDLLVVIGGASVGDHDRVKPALRTIGAELVVEGCAVRPGKPIWFARLGADRAVLGLPGNPASALVCAELFLGPILAALQGGVAIARPEQARLATALPANGPRDHYMRGVFEFHAGSGAAAEADTGTGWRVRAFGDQDSSLLSVLGAADGLIRRAPNAPALEAGDWVEVLRS